MFKLTFLLLTICAFALNPLYSQEEKNWMEYTPEEVEENENEYDLNDSLPKKKLTSDTLFKDTLTLNFNQPQEGSVEINSPDQLKNIIELFGTPIPPDQVQLDGYRIQIHFGQEKNEANQERANFMARHNDIPVYLDYQAPNFRVRVGDFRNRLEAEKYKHELEAEYAGLVIVHAKVNLPPIPEKEDSLEIQDAPEK